MKIKHDAQGPRTVHECQDCKPQHTPTPWKITERKAYFGVSNIHIESEKGYTVCRLEGKKTETETDAAYIVRVTSNFDKMLAAMKQVKASLDQNKYGDRKEGQLEGYFALCDAINEAEK